MRRHFLKLIRPRRSRSPAENMNSSHQIQNEFPGNCVVYIFIGGKPDHLSDLSYAILVALIVIHATTCPFTILLNLLVMIAVKTKARLQSISNMAQTCLALTDVMVLVIALKENEFEWVYFEDLFHPSLIKKYSACKHMNKKLSNENRVVKVHFLFYFRPRIDVRK